MSDLTSAFDNARKDPSGETLDRILHNYTMLAQMRDLDVDNVAGLRINNPSKNGSASSKQEKDKKDTDDLLFQALLDDIERRLKELEARMAVLAQRLTVKYGKDFVAGMASTFLTDEEKEGLETDEDYLRALADKMLDNNGNIKDKYKDTPEAQYVRDWREQQRLTTVVAKYDGRDTLAPDEKREIYNTAKTLPNVDAENLRQASDNEAVKETAATVVDENITKEEKSYSKFSIPVTT